MNGGERCNLACPPLTLVYRSFNDAKGCPISSRALRSRELRLAQHDPLRRSSHQRRQLPVLLRRTARASLLSLQLQLHANSASTVDYSAARTACPPSSFFVKLTHGSASLPEFSGVQILLTAKQSTLHTDES